MEEKWAIEKATEFSGVCAVFHGNLVELIDQAKDWAVPSADSQ